MREALRQAARAGRAGEVPIGAIVVVTSGGEDGSGEGDRILGRGANRPIRSHDPTAHAEVVALRAAARRMRNYRLTGAELFVTLEPCLMCVGALLQARIGRIVFGASDPKVGTLTAPGGLERLGRLNHRFEVRGGVLEDEASTVLARFFKARR